MKDDDIQNALNGLLGDSSISSGEPQHQRPYYNPSCFSRWFPAVQELGIRHPRSVVIDFPSALTMQVLNEQFETADDALRSIVKDIREAGDTFGYPLFMKNSLFSGKHSWAETCFIPESATDNEIIGRIITLTNLWAVYGFEEALHLVIREFIHAEPLFHAFGGMPVTAEYRVFAVEGTMYGWQPYWPVKAVVDPDVADWEARLATIEKPTGEELKQMRIWSEAVTTKLGGYWSVDFLRDKQGELWLIDMAEGRKSFRCPDGFRVVANLVQTDEKPCK